VAVQLAVDLAEVERAAVFWVELEVDRFFFVYELVVPGTHGDDAPAASEGVWGFRFLLDCVLVVFYQRLLPFRKVWD